MTVPILQRAITSLETEGRTLVGLAMPWDRPASVSDNGRTRYLESFDPASHDNTLRQRGPQRPLFLVHNYARSPIGVANFRRSDAEGGMMYEAPVSRTRDGDEALELVNDGAMRSVSEGFKPINQVRRTAPDGARITHRTEVAAMELSLAPTGFGQHPDASVHAVRAEQMLRDVINSQDPDRDPGVIAQAIDAANDALAVAIAAGDLQTAAALSAVVDLAVDHLLELFKVGDPDDPEGDGDEQNMAMAMTEPPAARAALARWLAATPTDVLGIGK